MRQLCYHVSCVHHVTCTVYSKCLVFNNMIAVSCAECISCYNKLAVSCAECISCYNKLAVSECISCYNKLAVSCAECISCYNKLAVSCAECLGVPGLGYTTAVARCVLVMEFPYSSWLLPVCNGYITLLQQVSDIIKQYLPPARYGGFKFVVTHHCQLQCVLWLHNNRFTGLKGRHKRKRRLKMSVATSSSGRFSEAAITRS